MDCSALVLNKLLLDKDVDIWSKLKVNFLDTAYTALYSAISRYYDKYSEIPSFDELALSIREGNTSQLLISIKAIDEPDIEGHVALDALIDQYTQNLTIAELDKFLDNLPIYDCSEIKENLSNLVTKLDERTHSTEGFYTMSNILLFKDEAQLQKERFHLGINNLFDSTLNGVARQELVLIGGPRGSGKSITSSNILVNQYESGNTAVIFTIEMIAHEVMERNMAILANVPYMRLKQNTLSNEELLQVIKARASMFEGADDLVEAYLRHKDKYKFEAELVKSKELKKDNQMIIIDDRSLTITSIDLHLGKLKARFGDKLSVCVVDYLNQIVAEGQGHSQFDWQPQIVISKKLKELARKHDVVMVSPYQVDSSGEARFAKGILDAPDIAILMKSYPKDKGAIGFETTKIRGGPPLASTSVMDWETLRIIPTPIEVSDAQEDEPKPKREKKATKGSSEPPWDI